LERVKGHRYLYRRGGQLVFRRGVPKRARSSFGGRCEIQKSLGTGSLSEARHLLSRELAAFDKALSAAIGVRSPTEVLEPTTRQPSTLEVEEGVRLWFAERVGRLEEEADAIGDEQRAVALARDYKALSQNVASGVRIGGENVLMTQWIVEKLMERFGWRIAAGNRLHRRLTKLVSRGQIEASQRFQQELNGDPVRVLDDTFSPEQYRLDTERQRERRSQTPISILTLFEGYARERKPAPATVKAWRRQLSAFAAFAGHDDATKVTPEDVVAWKDHLLHKAGESGSGLSAKTVGDGYLSALKMTLRWGVENRRLAENPAANTRVRGAKRVYKRERGLTNDEARTILAATLTPPPPRLSPERALARRWVPWLCAYTGARVNEITQLRGKDVVEIDGVWTIHITPEAGRIKTSMARTVALHSHLKDQGFLDVAAANPSYLFFNPGRQRGGSEGNPHSKKVGEYLARWVREIGVADPDVQPNHGWRHRFKTVSRNVRMDPEVRDRIQGHAPRTEGEGYGDVSPAAMRREIELLPRYEVMAEFEGQR
jgi:integrase